ncbi:MAG: hypothetical protein ACYCO3_00460 [Mycobacteriales bacterium]
MSEGPRAARPHRRRVRIAGQPARPVREGRDGREAAATDDALVESAGDAFAESPGEDHAREDHREDHAREDHAREAEDHAREDHAREDHAREAEDHDLDAIERLSAGRSTARAGVADSPDLPDWGADFPEEPGPEDATEDATGETALPAPPARAGVRRLLLPVGLAAVVAALAVVVGVLAVDLAAAEAAQQARRPALAAAEAAVDALLSVNYQHLAADVTKANGYLTPAFRKSYDKFRASFAPTYAKYHTVIAPAIAAGGLRNVTGNSAVALLFVDQVTTGTNRSSPRVDQARVRVTLVYRGGRWLVSSLAAL